MITAVVHGWVVKDAADGKFGVKSSNWAKAGEDKTATFVNCRAFGKTAEYVEKYGVRDAECIVVGRLEQREYEGKRYLNMTVDSIEFIRSQTTRPVAKPAPKPEVDDCSLPFDL